MKVRGLTFYETITKHAEQENIHIHHIQRTEYEPSSEVRKLIRANEWLMKLYYHLLRFTKDGKIAYNYLMDRGDRKSTRLNSSHVAISYAVFCLKKKNKQ